MGKSPLRVAQISQSLEAFPVRRRGANKKATGNPVAHNPPRRRNCIVRIYWTMKSVIEGASTVRSV